MGVIDCHELGAWGGDDAVEHEFNCEKIGGGCAAIVRVIDEVAAHCDAGAIWVLLF